jgi:phage-related minor tail protein
MGGESGIPKDPKKVGGGVGGGNQESNLDKLIKEQSLRKELLTLSGQEKILREEIIAVTSKLGEESSKMSAAQIQGIAQVNLALSEQEVLQKQVQSDYESVVSTMADALGAGLTSLVDGTKSVKEAFKDMARAVIAELWKVYVVQKIVTGVKKFFAFSDGGVFSGGTVDKKFANGGVVNGPTTFPMSGGKTGLMGEAGPEAIMPLKRGKGGKLGVSMEGGGSQSIVVNQSFNFQANGDESVKKIIAQAAPQIAQMTKKSMIDDRRRGGQMKATFG